MTCEQLVKGIDAVTREQLVQIMALLGIGNLFPVFSMVPMPGPIRTSALLPTVDEEDKVILNNVQKIIEFLAAGTANSSNQVTTSFFVVPSVGIGESIIYGLHFYHGYQLACFALTI